MCGAFQTVQRNRERAEVEAVAIVDQRGAVYALQGTHAHVHRHQVREAFVDPFRCAAQVQANGDAGKRVLRTGIIGERDGERVLCSCVPQRDVGRVADDLLRDHLHEVRCTSMPEHGPFQRSHPWKSVVQLVQFHRVVRMDPHLRTAEQLQLLGRLRIAAHSLEPFVVRAAQVGEHTDRRPDHRFQLLHLARLADARFEDGQGVLRAHLQHAQRHAHLAVPAARAAYDVFLAVQHLEQPFLHDGLAVAAGDPDNGDSELAAVPSGDLLQCRERIRDTDHGKPLEFRHAIVLYDGHPEAALHQLRDVVVAIVSRAGQGDEQGGGCDLRVTRIDDDTIHQRVTTTAQATTDHFGNARERMLEGAHGVSCCTVSAAWKQVRHSGS